MTLITQISLSKQSNLYYLPLLYFLPEEIFRTGSTISRVPRRAREVFYSKEMTALVESDQFFNELMDAVAALVFPHFGFGGWKEDYTGYFPVWKLSYALPLWVEALEKETGLNLQSLFMIPSTDDIPFVSDDVVCITMKKVVKRVISEQNWQPMLDVIRQMPCDEDFEFRNSNVRKDFIRKWYHTRSKRVKTTSLESYLEDENNSFHDLIDSSSDFEEAVIAKDYCDRFIKTLTERDMEILKMRMEGFTYKKIAERLGYKNHSGIVKRIKFIANRYLEYEEKHNS